MEKLGPTFLWASFSAVSSGRHVASVDTERQRGTTGDLAFYVCVCVWSWSPWRDVQGSLQGGGESVCGKLSQISLLLCMHAFARQPCIVQEEGRICHPAQKLVILRHVCYSAIYCHLENISLIQSNNIIQNSKKCWIPRSLRKCNTRCSLLSLWLINEERGKVYI